MLTAPTLTICGQCHYGLLIEPNIMYHNSKDTSWINAFLFRRFCKGIGKRKCLTLIICLGVVHYNMLLFITGKYTVQEMMYEKYKCYYVTYNLRAIEKKFTNWKKNSTWMNNHQTHYSTRWRNQEKNLRLAIYLRMHIM